MTQKLWIITVQDDNDDWAAIVAAPNRTLAVEELRIKKADSYPHGIGLNVDQIDLHDLDMFEVVVSGNIFR